MTGYVAKGNNIFDGSAVVAEDQVLKNGMFADLTVAAAGNTAAPGSQYFVANEDDTIDEEAINTVDITLKEGKAVKMKRILTGEEIVTDQTAMTLAVSDKAYAQAGKLSKTKVDGGDEYTVLEVISIGDNTMYRALKTGVATAAAGE